MAFNWDHFYPLYGEPDGKHFECWTLLAAWAEQTDARRGRRPRHLQQLPQPGAARRHGPHRRPRLRRPADPRHRLGLVRARLRPSTATSSAPPAAASTPSPRRCRGSRRAGPSSTRRRRARSRSSSVAAASARRCASSPATPTSGTASATSPRSPTRTRCSTSGARKEGRDPAAIERSCGVQGSPADGDALYDVGVRLFTIGMERPRLGPRPRRGLARLARREERRIAAALVADSSLRCLAEAGPPGLRPNARPDHPRSLRTTAEAVAAPPTSMRCCRSSWCRPGPHQLLRVPARSREGARRGSRRRRSR